MAFNPQVPPPIDVSWVFSRFHREHGDALLPRRWEALHADTLLEIPPIVALYGLGRLPEQVCVEPLHSDRLDGLRASQPLVEALPRADIVDPVRRLQPRPRATRRGVWPVLSPGTRRVCPLHDFPYQVHRCGLG